MTEPFMPITAMLSDPTLRVIAIGAAVGTVAGAAVVGTFALLSGKSLAGAALAKPLLRLLLPGAVGGAVGGAAGAGLAQRRVQQPLAPRCGEVGDADHRQVLHAAEVPAPSGPALAEAKPQGERPTPPTDSGAHRAEAKELQRVRGIGPRYAALLVAGGVRSLADLARAEPAQIEGLLGMSAAAPGAAATRWIKQARELTAAGGPLGHGSVQA
jgi:predicted flap endonuclease-1-like 5' DNA nuclease